MNDFTSVARARYDARCQLLQFSDITIVPREPAQARLSVRDDRCERLLYLMGDRACHLAKRRNSRSMSVVRLDLPQLGLRAQPFCDVLDGDEGRLLLFVRRRI